MEEYLAFIEEIGRTINGEFTYRFYFTYDTEIVWGEYFNVCPCSIIPNLFPDINSLSHKVDISFSQQLNIVVNNMCFSMQDCIDGIIPLAFVDIYENDFLKYNNKPLFFPFGENKNIIINKCNSVNAIIGDFEIVATEKDNIIDAIIDNIDNDDEIIDNEDIDGFDF